MKQVLQEIFMKKKLASVENYLTDFLNFEDDFIRSELKAIFSSGGKRLRPALLLMVASYFDNKSSDIYKTAGLMELVHMASLIHDDINDNALIRRNQPTLNAKYNDNIAIHLGDFLLIETLLGAYEVEHTELILEHISYLAMEMSKGEISQIESMFNLDQTISDYYYRIERKTAILIATSCRLGAILSNANKKEEKAFYQYGYHIGLAFQIKDDLFDLSQITEKSIGKPIGHDLEQGLLNLPTLLVLEKEFPEKEILKELIKNRFPNGEKDLVIAKNIIEAQKGLEEAELIMLEHIEKAKSYLSVLHKNKYLSYFYEGADYIIQRTV